MVDSDDKTNETQPKVYDQLEYTCSSLKFLLYMERPRSDQKAVNIK